jgi:drug/metabolite transporter (DMT)-like permease
MKAGSTRNAAALPALGAALLFGAGTPLAKLLLQNQSPWLLAGLLYLGSGIGLTLYRVLSRAEHVRLPREEIPWLAGAIVSGGVAAPLLLMFGLTRMLASGASLLLNAESVITALLAWFAFKENFDRRIALGMLAIAAGAAIVSWPSEMEVAGLWPALAVLGACLCWGIDNNLTRKVSLNDAAWIASIKGLVAGAVNFALAGMLGFKWPGIGSVAGAMTVGFLAYGVNLTLFVIALRNSGTARTGAYFSVAPFFGALLALLLGEPLTLSLMAAALLMVAGLWLHLTERHQHPHRHLEEEHEHEHQHDDHHQHRHGQPVMTGVSHRHRHRHQPIAHSHAHFPDAHHKHRH